MGISLKTFIGKYLTREDIKDALDSIREKVGGNVSEIESRLASEWPKYRDVYDLLDYVDEDDLLEICDHFSIHTNATTHGALKKRIKESGIITGHTKKINKTNNRKKSTSNNLSNNSSPMHLSKTQWNGVIVGIIAAIILTGLSMWWTSHTAELEFNNENNVGITQLESNYKEISELKQLVKENIENQNSIFHEFGIESQIDPDKKIELPPEIIKQIDEQDQEIKRLNSEIEQLTNEKQQLDIDYSNKIANLQYYSGNYSKFISTNNQILVKNPHNAVNLNNKAVVLSDQGNFTGALYYYDESLEIDPTKESTIKNKIITLSNYGVLLSTQGNYTDAVYYYDQALEMDPNQIQVWVNKGTTLNNFNQYPEAISSYYQALEIDSQNQLLLDGLENSFYNYGVSLYNTGDYDAALSNFNKALQINDTNEKVWELREKTLQKIN